MDKVHVLNHTDIAKVVNLTACKKPNCVYFHESTYDQKDIQTGKVVVIEKFANNITKFKPYLSEFIHKYLCFHPNMLQVAENFINQVKR